MTARQRPASNSDARKRTERGRVIVSPDQQAMHEALGILGFDLDGDPTPGAVIAGMGADGFRGYFTRCIHEARRDHDEAIA